MSQRSFRMPGELPPIERGLELFLQWRDAPNKLLGGMAPIDLFKGPFLDLDRTFFIGSCAWMPIVTGKLFKEQDDARTKTVDHDIDICFADKDQADAFTDAAPALLHEKTVSATWRLDETVNRFGGRKIVRSDYAGEVIDIAWLHPQVSIAEFIAAFKQDHEKVAIVASARPHDLTAVTRLVRPFTHNKRDPAHREICYACQRDYEEYKKAEAEREYIDFS